MKALLTPAEVGKVLRISRRKVLALDIPRVPVGRKIMFRESDVEAFIDARVTYPQGKGGNNANRVSKGKKKMGIPVLPSRRTLQAIQMGYPGGSEKGGAGSH